VVVVRSAVRGRGREAARILNAAHTILLHAVPDPEPIVKAAGTRLAIEQSLQHHDGLSTDIGSSRQQHQLKADPNEVRRLQTGMCYALGVSRPSIPEQPIAGQPAPTVRVFETPDDDEPLRL
jgi:hypothetical protein